MIRLQDSGNSEDKVKYDVTTTQHIVRCNIMVDTKVQNKTPSWLLNVVLYSRRPAGIING